MAFIPLFYSAQAATTTPVYVPPAVIVYPYGIGKNMYALLRGLGRALAVPDAQLQTTLGAMRLQSCTGAQIDSWAYDFFRGAFYRFAQYGESDQQFIARIEAILSTPKATPAGMQSIINVFWPFIRQQFAVQNLGEDSGIGGEDTVGGEDVAVAQSSLTTVSGLAIGEDTYGGEDTGNQFEDAPGVGNIPAVPVVFDAQSNPTLATAIAMAPPQFGIYIRYPNYSDSLMKVVLSPSQILTQLVNIWKAAGTVPIYLTNR